MNLAVMQSKNPIYASDLVALINKGKFIVTWKQGKKGRVPVRAYYKERGQYYSEHINTAKNTLIPNQKVLLDIAQSLQRENFTVENDLQFAYALDDLNNPKEPKSENPNLTKLQSCKKLIAEEESKYHKPTISYYRDMKNPSSLLKEAFKKVESLDRQVKKASDRYLQTGSIKDKQRLFELEKQQNNAYASLRNLTKTLKTRNPTSRAKTTTVKNPSESMLNFMRDVWAQEKKYGGGVFIPYLSTEQKRFVANNSDLFRKKDGGKTLMLSAKGKNLINVKNPKTATAKRNHSNADFKTVKSANPKKDNVGAVSITQALYFVLNKTKADIARIAQVSSRTVSGYIDKPHSNNVLAWQERSKKAQLESIKFAKQWIRQSKNPNHSNADFNAHLANTTRKNSRMFQGKLTGVKTQLVAPNGTPKNLSRLGALKLMIVKLPNGQKANITFEKNAYLAMDIRKNLHCVGSGAKINGVKVKGNGLAELGRLIQIDYVTDKKHINGNQLTHFYHKLGEVTGEVPRVFVDKERFPIIQGGNYDVWKVGIVN